VEGATNINAAMADNFKAQTTLAKDWLNEQKSCFDNETEYENNWITGQVLR